MNSLREIQAIKRLAPHPNIVKLEEVLFDPPSGRLALVFELLEGNLYELMKGKLWLELFYLYSTYTWLSNSSTHKQITFSYPLRSKATLWRSNCQVFYAADFYFLGSHAC